MKVFRRLIIVFSLAIIIFSAFQSMPKDKLYIDNLKEGIKDGTVQVISVNQQQKIDNDIFKVKNVEIASDSIYVQFRKIVFTQGWSFSWGNFRLTDEKGEEYKISTADAEGKLWGEDACIKYKRPDNAPINKLILTYDQYNRKIQFVIPLKKEGRTNE